MKVAAYLRVSTIEQAENGHGLDAQRSAIRQWANQGGHKVVAWYADEGVSGSNALDARNGLLSALGAVQGRQAGGLVVFRLDRLARDLVVSEAILAEVWRSGGRVFSCSTTEDAYLDPEGADADPSRALVRQILGAVASYEKAMIRLRLRAGKAAKAAKGGFVGGSPPLGWRAQEGALVAVDDEQAAVRRILELRSEGASLRSICVKLTDEGYKPKRSNRWHAQSVALVLDRAGI